MGENRETPNMESCIGGEYAPEKVLVLHAEKGKAIAIYRDSAVTERENEIERERLIRIRGKRYIVHSIFKTDAEYTPTDKLLRYIDTKIEPCAHAE